MTATGTRNRPMPAPLVLVGGLLAGAAWGAFARLWMRFISTDPGFTWSGTLTIVIGFAVVGLAQSGAYLGRRAGLSRPRLTALRIITVASLLFLGLAAGGPLVPTIIVAPLALTHREWAPWVRGLLGLIAAVPILRISVSLFDQLSPARATLAALWMLVIYAVIVWAATFSLAPQPDGWRAPRPARWLGTVGAVLAAAVDVLLVVTFEP